MKTKLISLLVLLCWLPMVAGAQEMSGALSTYDLYHNLPGTPTAVSLARSINCPVDHRTGVVDVKIPLYELEVNDIKIPIYLSYHSSGIRVRDPFSWVGAGWTLHAEPTVTRTVLGAPDENWFIKEDGYKSIYDQTIAERYKNVYVAQCDHFSDRYYYSLLDDSGEFLFYKDGKETKSVIYPFKPYKLSYDTEYGYFKNFTITDDKGLIYNFGNSACGISHYENSSEDVYTEWKCNTVRSPHTGTIVKFDYQERTLREMTDDDFVLKETLSSAINEFPSTYVNYVIANREVWKDGHEQEVYVIDRLGNKTTGILNSIEQAAQFPTRRYGYITKDHTVWYITCGEYDIEFKTKTLHNTQVLDEVIVYHQKLRKIKRIKFYISRMNPAFDESIYAEHCKLDSLYFCEGNGNVVEKYRMNYYNTNLPSKTSKDIDHWGYYNEARNSGTLVANQSAFRNILTGANRDANDATAYYGSLKSITYPTGGKTIFEYELNKLHMAGTAPNVDSEGGGLRIAQITETSLTGESVIRKFEYGPGLCRYQPFDVIPDSNVVMYPFFFKKEQTHYYFSSNNLSGDVVTNVTYYPAHPLLEPNFSKGPVVEYGSVTEIRSDSTQTLYEYERTPFSNYNEYEYPYWDTRDQWKYGQLKRRVDYKKNAETGNYIKVRSIGNQYAIYNELGVSYHSLDERYLLHGGWEDEDIPEIPFITIYAQTGIKHLEVVNDTLFDDAGNYSITRTEYSYKNTSDKSYSDGTALLRQTTVNYPDGTVDTERTWYPNDLTLANGSEEDGRNRLISTNRLSTPLKKQTSRDSIATATAAYVYEVDTTGIAQISGLRLGRESADVERIHYSHHNVQGKPRYKVTDGTRNTVYLYSYEGDRLVAEIKDATYEEVETALGSDFIAALNGKTATESDFTILEALETEHPQWHITLFKHSMGNGVTFIKSPGGLPLIYDYDNFRRLIAIYIQEADDNRTLLEKFSYNYTNPINY